MTMWSELQWDAAPTREESHADHLAALWEHADAQERRAIVRERMRDARTRRDPRCPRCHGRQRASCTRCGGSGYAEPALRSRTATETAIADALQDVAYRDLDRAVGDVTIPF